MAYHAARPQGIYNLGSIEDQHSVFWLPTQCSLFSFSFLKNIWDLQCCGRILYMLSLLPLVKVLYARSYAMNHFKFQTVSHVPGRRGDCQRMVLGQATGICHGVKISAFCKCYSNPYFFKKMWSETKNCFQLSLKSNWRIFIGYS